MSSFDLTTQPWVPCRRADGVVVELGLEETLLHAHDLREISDTSPLVKAALHRLLLAILHRCFGPPELRTWTALYRSGRFAEETIRGYLAKWRHRLDLFHPDRPFYQVRGLAQKFEADPTARLIAERSNWGPGTALFRHRSVEQAELLAPAAAARHLLALNAFAPGGLVRKEGEPPSATAAPLNRGAVVLVTGDSLFETLMLNLVVYSSEQPIPRRSHEDVPAWEQDRPTQIARRRPEGWIDLLTWQSRRLELQTDDAGRVNGVVYCVGQTLETDGLLDPMLGYRRHKERGFIPIEFDVERVAWRDLHALIRPLQNDGDSVPPKAIDLLARRELRAVVPPQRRLSIELLGMRGDQAKIYLVRAERFPIAPRLLDDEERHAVVREVIHLAEEAGFALRLALRQAARTALSFGSRQPDKDDVTRLVESLGAEIDYWSQLGKSFEQFLDLLLDEPTAARTQFVAAVRRAAEHQFDGATRALGTSARALKGISEGQMTLWRELRFRRVETPEESSSKEVAS